MNKYHLQIAHQSPQLTVIVVENRTINTSQTDNMIWSTASIQVEAIVIKHIEKVCAFNATGERLELAQLMEKVVLLKEIVTPG